MRIVHGGMLPAGLLQISSGFTRAIAAESSPRDRRRLKTLGLMLSLSGAPYLALGAGLIGGQADTAAGAVWGAGFVIVALGYLAAGLFLLWRCGSHDRPGGTLGEWKPPAGTLRHG